MADIITDMRGAVRRGLYAAFSIRTPNATVAISTRGIHTAIGIQVAAYTIKKPAIIKMSPCAKLIRRSMPYTIV